MTKTKSQPPEINPQDVIMSLYSQTLQQQRIIYLLVKAMGGSVSLDENSVTPLWGLGHKRLENGHLQLLTKELEPLNETQLITVVTFLRGTSKLLTDGMAHAGISEYPSHYIQQAISMAITWDVQADKWIDTKDVPAPPDPTRN